MNIHPKTFRPKWSFVKSIPERVEHGHDDAAGEDDDPADEEKVGDADEDDASCKDKQTKAQVRGGLEAWIIRTWVGLGYKIFFFFFFFPRPAKFRQL
jgi:hypothetical protein